jgi:hypothetical protein
MVPHTLEGESLPNGVEVFRCANLSCAMFYATGAMEGFYTLESSGELTPYAGQ